MLHDLTVDSCGLKRLQVLDCAGAGGELTGLTVAERSFAKQHPVQAARVAHQFKDLPADVELIIEQHHENPDGTGFPLGLKEHEIHPLSLVFILAHRIVADRFAYGEKSSPLKVISDLPASYRVGKFKDILEAMEKALIKK
jgi:hypothetical protein